MKDQDLYDAFQQVHRQMRRSLAQATPDLPQELAPSQARLLRILSHHSGSSQKELAAFMRIRPASLSEVLTKLEQKNLLEKEQDPADRRRNRYFLSSAGKDLAQNLQQERRDQGGAFFASLTVAEKADLLAILEKLNQQPESLLEE
ncbi:MarR family winged helix-turn-helix transcriptional regulator [Enterococcus sp. 2201sp1_2201st1_B8_2201SCRN_220225]|uniref:MarR family winged helix-turn-helix transcriptional regulator n=1 Tax=unclassified Enterococcus TaxID=2608891 RepID=UPI0034A4B4AF